MCPPSLLACASLCVSLQSLHHSHAQALQYCEKLHCITGLDLVSLPVPGTPGHLSLTAAYEQGEEGGQCVVVRLFVSNENLVELDNAVSVQSISPGNWIREFVDKYLYNGLSAVPLDSLSGRTGLLKAQSVCFLLKASLALTLSTKKHWQTLVLLESVDNRRFPLCCALYDVLNSPGPYLPL